MRSTVYKIKDLENLFRKLGKTKKVKEEDSYENKKETKSSITNVERAPKSGEASDLIAHHQGMYCFDGEGEFIITGSVKESSPYFYIFQNSEGKKCIAGKDYYQIECKEFTHPGGVQVAECLLAVGLEKYSGATTKTDKSYIYFFNICDQGKIFEVPNTSIHREGKGAIASAIGLTYRNNQWVMAVRAKDTMDFYASNDVSAGFSLLNKIELKTYNLKDFQNINLFLDDKNDMFLIGMNGEGDGSKDDIARLYKLSLIEIDGNVKSVSAAEHKAKIHFHGKNGHFRWASCVQYCPNENKFVMYASSMHVVKNKITLSKWE